MLPLRNLTRKGLTMKQAPGQHGFNQAITRTNGNDTCTVLKIMKICHDWDLVL